MPRTGGILAMRWLQYSDFGDSVLANGSIVRRQSWLSDLKPEYKKRGVYDEVEGRCRGRRHIRT